MVDTSNMTINILSSSFNKRDSQQVFVKNSSIKEHNKGSGPGKCAYVKRTNRQLQKATNCDMVGSQLMGIAGSQAMSFSKEFVFIFM